MLMDCRGMILSKHKIEQAIVLSQAFSGHLARPETDMSLLLWPEKLSRKVDHLMEEVSAQCRTFKSFLGCLTDIEFRELQALMFIGRGDYRPEEFEKAFDETWVDGDRELEILYMMGKAAAPEHFAEGFEKLNRARMI